MANKGDSWELGKKSQKKKLKEKREMAVSQAPFNLRGGGKEAIRKRSGQNNGTPSALEKYLKGEKMMENGSARRQDLKKENRAASLGITSINGVSTVSRGIE